jgi:hypothetical protein
MAKLKQFSTSEEMAQDENQEIIKTLNTVVETMIAYQNEKVEQWKKEIDQTSQQSLRKPLLKYDQATESMYKRFIGKDFLLTLYRVLCQL